jgi:hypothetical protein
MYIYVCKLIYVYVYAGTGSDAKGPGAGTQSTCFSGTKVQILMLLPLVQGGVASDGNASLRPHTLVA